VAYDIFGRVPADYGGSFAADAAFVAFSLGPGVEGGVGMLTQQISFSYTQQISLVYEIGSRSVFYVAGRAKGEGQIARILGPRPVLPAFYAAYGNICRANQNTLLFQVVSGCNNPGDVGAGLAFALIGVVIPSITISVQSPQEMMISEQLSLLYVALIV
jgi:hypothetical protein